MIFCIRKTITCLALSGDGGHLVTGEMGHRPRVKVRHVRHVTCDNDPLQVLGSSVTKGTTISLIIDVTYGKRRYGNNKPFSSSMNLYLYRPVPVFRSQNSVC